MDDEDAFGHEWHPWLGRTVLDIPSKGTGRLMAVVREQVRDFEGREHWVELAYIRPASGIEWSTAVANLHLLL